MEARDIRFMEPEDLLAHHGRVRSLALALTRSEADADDAAQDTWLAAIRRPPRDPRSARSWLTAVLRNFVRRRHRDAERKRARDRVAARPEVSGDGDPADMAARAELHAAVAAAIVALEEPYRTSVLFRHFEGCPVEEVARRTGVPLETARSRLRRGREMLRTRLVRRLGADLPLAVALRPLLELAPTATPAPIAAGSLAGTGGALMAMKSVVVTAAIAAVSVAAIFLVTAPGAGPKHVQQAERGGAGAGPPPRPEGLPPAAPRESAAGAAGGASSGRPPAPESSPPGIAPRLDAAIPAGFAMEGVPFREALGRVSGVTGVPVYLVARNAATPEEVNVTLRLAAIPARDAFRLLAAIAGLEVAIEDVRLVFHPRGQRWSPDVPAEHVPPVPPGGVVEPPLRVHGVVRDPAGRGVAAVVLLDGVEVARAGEDGRWEFETACRSFGLVAHAPMTEELEPVMLSGDPGAVLEQELRVGAPAGALDLVVTLPAGTPPEAGACATLEWTPRNASPDARRRMTVRTGPGGAAACETLPAGDVRVLVSAPGCRPETRTVQIATGERTALAIELRAATLAQRLQETRISFHFRDAAPREVVDYIALVAHVTIVVDPPLNEAIAGRRISVDAFDETLENALLEWCSSAGDAEFVIEEEGGFVVLRQRQ